MAIASSNLESLGYEVESTAGTTVGTTKKYINFTSCNLGAEVQYTNSNNIRSDTNIAGTVQTSLDASGDIGIELQYGGYDDFLEGVMRGAFTTAINITSGTSVTYNSAGKTISATGIDTNAVVGQWIAITGTNAGYYRITAKSSGVITVEQTIATNGASTTTAIKSSWLKNSTTKKSYSIERHFTDLTNQYVITKGARVNTFGLNFPLNAIATGSISFLAFDSTTATSTGFGATTAAPTTASMNSVDNVQAVFIDGTETTYSLTNFDFSITTNAEALKAIGSKAAIDILQNSIGVTGNIGIYMSDTALITKLRNGTSVDLAFVVEDAAGNGYIFSFPEVKLTSGGAINNGGTNQTLVQNFGFTAIYDSTYSITAGIAKYPA